MTQNLTNRSSGLTTRGFRPLILSNIHPIRLYDSSIRNLTRDRIPYIDRENEEALNRIREGTHQYAYDTVGRGDTMIQDANPTEEDLRTFDRMQEGRDTVIGGLLDQQDDLQPSDPDCVEVAIDLDRRVREAQEECERAFTQFVSTLPPAHPSSDSEEQEEEQEESDSETTEASPENTTNPATSNLDDYADTSTEPGH